LVVWTKHFTGFATFGSSSSGGTSTAGGSGGAGATGIGPSGGAGGGVGAFGGTLVPQLKIYEVSYDVCDKSMVRIIIGTNETAPTVILRSSISKIINAKLTTEQTFAGQNPIHKFIFEAPINPNEKTFEVVVIGHGHESIGKTVQITSCKEDINYENVAKQIQPQIGPTAPKIFDVRFQLGDGTKVLSSDTTNQYVSSQPLSVYSIVDSPTSISHAELRFVKMGQDMTKYTVINMDIKPLKISNSTYVISAIIPQGLLEGPAISYWIHVQNAHKTTDSDQYTIGVRPDYTVDGKLELDILQNRAEGTTSRSTAYFTSKEPAFGTISLLVDGKTVYTSHAQLLKVGQTPVILEWKTPTLEQLTSYQVQAKAEFYGKSFETDTTTVNTFQASKTISIMQPININIITDKDGNTIAKPTVLYSSFKNEGTMRYKVMTPDGTCVIGGADNCLVKQSTLGLKGNFKSITNGDQVYRIRYSGPDSSLERFSITSVDPIVGTWKVEIDSDNNLVPQAHAMEDVFLKVKYRAQETPFVTELK